MAKLLAIDLDGTLFFPKGHKHLISKKNLEFLRRFIDEGNKVVLVTSRTPDFCRMIVELIDRDIDYICHCGAVISLNNEIVKNESVPNDALIEVLDKVKSKFHPIGYFLTCADNPIIVCPNIKLSNFMRKFYLNFYKKVMGIYREEILIDENKFWELMKTGHLYDVKSYFGLSAKSKKRNVEINQAIREKFPFIESSDMGLVLEFSSKGCNKGESLLEYIDYIHADKKDVYVIGDSGNDISMFDTFHENSFCMMHAYPHVKSHAMHRVSRVYKLEKYLFERSKNE